MTADLDRAALRARLDRESRFTGGRDELPALSYRDGYALLDATDRLEADLAEAQARVAAVEALAEPMGKYRHYAVAIDEDVILAVGLDDLRAALGGGDAGEGESVTPQ